MLNKRQEIFQNAIEGKLKVKDRASERMQERIIEEMKEFAHRKTEEASQIAGKSMTFGCTKMRKKKRKKMQAVRKLRKDEEMTWPDWEEARKMENGEWMLEPEGEAEVPEILIVSDAVWKALSWTWMAKAAVSR